MGISSKIFQLILMITLSISTTSVAQSPPYSQVWCLGASGSSIFAGTNGGLYLSTNCGTTWAQVYDRPTVSVAIDGSNIFVGTAILNLDQTAGVSLSTDNGVTWIRPNLPNWDVYSLAIRDTVIYAGTITGGIFVSTDNGSTWTARNAGLTNQTVYSIAAVGSNIYAGTEEGLFSSSDNGLTWKQNGPINVVVSSIEFSDANIYVGTWRPSGEGWVYLSTNNGLTWTQAGSGLTDTLVYSLAVSGSNLFAGTAGGVFLSTNNGLTWTERNTGLANTIVSSLLISDTNIYAGTWGGVFLSTNNGLTWEERNVGLTYVKEWSKALPDEYSLDQNYPNPFNPTTFIRYQLPVSSFVTLNVYDVLGREVKTLVNARESVGDYSVTFNASNLPSGVYLYRLQAGTFIQTKKLVVIK